MSFKNRSNERERWDDALDRLRDLRAELRESQRNQDDPRDLWLRGGTVVAITLIVAYAVYRL